MSDMTNAIMAALNVDQQGLQTATKGLSAAQFASPDEASDVPAFRYYQAQMEAEGQKPLTLEQWRIVFRNDRAAGAV